MDIVVVNVQKLVFVQGEAEVVEGVIIRGSVESDVEVKSTWCRRRNSRKTEGLAWRQG